MLLHRKILRILVCLVISAMVLGMAAPAGSAVAQGISDIDVSFYGYIHEGEDSTFLIVGEVTSDIPGMAAEMVSPRYVDDFFAGFTDFRNYDFASDLPAAYIDQIDEADEYMVFAGDYVGGTSTLPSYVMLLSEAGKVFMLQGAVSNADDLFDLAALTIAEGKAPVQFMDYTRIQTAGSDASSETTSTGEQGSQQAEDDLQIFCYVDPNMAPTDLNGDGLITIDELNQFRGIEGVDGLIESMQMNGFDAVQYVGC